MTAHFKAAAHLFLSILQWLSLAVFTIAAIVLSVATGMAAFGVAPWLQFSVEFGGVTYDNAGMIAQIGLTALSVLLCVFLPANGRILALENSHRRFHIGMQDITRAYAAAHSADRAGMFHIKEEFDAVRERLTYMREHPDLESLEPEVLEVAAQMSQISRKLAEVYSDDNIDRARAFLKQREQEVALFNSRIDQAKAVSNRLRQWAEDVELEESVAMSQLERIREDLRDILPELGYEEVARLDGTVVRLPQRAE